MRARWEHELRQYVYSLGRAAAASAICSHGQTLNPRALELEGTQAKWSTEGRRENSIGLVHTILTPTTKAQIQPEQARLGPDGTCFLVGRPHQRSTPAALPTRLLSVAT